MRDIRVKDLIIFRNLSEKRRGTFYVNLQKEKVIKEKDDSTGGDYWVRSISALNNSFRNNDNNFVSEKIFDILSDYRPSMDKGTRLKYDRNIQILHNYEDFDFRSITPSENIEIKNKIGKRGVIELNRLNIKVETHNIYTFEDGDESCMGSVFFAAKIKGYKTVELGIFTEAIYNYLTLNHSDKYSIHPKYITVIDVMTQNIVDYQMILDGKLPALLLPSIEEIRDFQIRE